MGQASSLAAVAGDLNQKLVKLGVFRFLLSGLDLQIKETYLRNGAPKEMGRAEFHLDFV